MRFYAVDKLEQYKAGWLWAHPAPSEEHQQNERVGTVLGELSPALAQAYEDASGSLQDGRWSAAASEARRTLEGLVKHRLEDAGEKTGGTLEKLIEKLAGAIDLAAPLMDTAHTVRQGGNVGAHYDTDRTADEPLARQLLELVEAMVEYLELLPRRVADLRVHLENGPPEESGESNDGD